MRIHRQSSWTMWHADLWTHGFIHSAPFVEIVWFLQLPILCRFLLIFFLCILIKTENCFLCISLNWLYVNFISCCIQSCVIFKKEKRQVKWQMYSLYLCWDHVHVKSFGSRTENINQSSTLPNKMSMTLNKLLKYHIKCDALFLG